VVYCFPDSYGILMPEVASAKLTIKGHFCAYFFETLRKMWRLEKLTKNSGCEFQLIRSQRMGFGDTLATVLNYGDGVSHLIK